jgi:hypothetical protein
MISKMKQILVLGMFLSTANAMTVPSDYYTMSSGYNAGQLDVSFSGSSNGLVDRVVTAYLAAGATKIIHTDCPTCPFTTIQFPDDSKQTIVVSSAAGAGSAPEGMNIQWHFSLTLNDHIQINTMGSGIGFRGSVADAIYLGLSKSGATIIGETHDKDGDFTNPIYAAQGATYRIVCQKKAGCYLGLK